MVLLGWVIVARASASNGVQTGLGLDWAAPVLVLVLVDMAHNKGEAAEFVLAQLQAMQLVGKPLHCVVSVERLKATGSDLQTEF